MNLNQNSFMRQTHLAKNTEDLDYSFDIVVATLLPFHSPF